MMNGTISNGFFRHGANTPSVSNGTYNTTYLITGASRGLLSFHVFRLHHLTTRQA